MFVPAMLLLFFASLVALLLAPAFRGLPAPAQLAVFAVAAAFLATKVLWTRSQR
jgi:hypothetical protein